MCGSMSCSRLSLAILGVVIMVLGSATVFSLIWMRVNSKDEQKVMLSNEHNATPGDVYYLKQFFQQMYFVLFWALVIYGSGLVIAGVFGAFAGCSRSKVVSNLLFSFLTLLIIAEVTASVLAIIFRHLILERLNAYVTLSFRYNLEDIQFIRTKFNCCGDGTTNMYNYQCQGTEQKNCSELFEHGSTMFIVSTIVISVFLIAIQLIIAFLSASSCKRRAQATMGNGHLQMPNETILNQYAVPA